MTDQRGWATADSGATSQCLAEFAASAQWNELPAATVEHAQRAVLDWFGSALAGAHEKPARIVREIVAGFGTADEATVFPAGRAAAAGAALANGVASHILELDDVHKGSTLHGAAPIVSAALAVAEREHADGRAFLLAVVLGYEAALRIGEAVNPGHYRFWHPTGTVATFGAAVAAGSLLGLDGERMLDALGSAGTQAAGLWEFNADGAMSKHLHPGKAAFNGVLAVDLARRGYTGATRILEGERGFFLATSTSSDPTRIVDGLGERWKIAENGYKLHACCGHTHTAIDAVLALREQLAWSRADAVADVAAIRIATYGPGYDIVREPNPRTPYQAKFSIAYCVAVALLEGQVGLSQFSEERFCSDGPTDPAIMALLRRTSVVVDPALTDRYPLQWPVRLSLDLRQGSSVEHAADYPRGNPEYPVSTETLEAKARALIAPGYGETATDRVVAAVRSLPDSRNMSALVNGLFESRDG